VTSDGDDPVTLDMSRPQDQARKRIEITVSPNDHGALSGARGVEDPDEQHLAP